MKSILYTSYQESLNEIEYFVDEICEEFNLSNSLYGNILISITELIKLLEKYTTRGEISFSGDQSGLRFTFNNFTQIDGIESIFESEAGNGYLSSDPDKSIFMVKALSDDLIIDRDAKKIVCVFKNKGMKVELSKHRKDFLKKYLDQEVVTNV